MIVLDDETAAVYVASGLPTCQRDIHWTLHSFVAPTVSDMLQARMLASWRNIPNI